MSDFLQYSCYTKVNNQNCEATINNRISTFFKSDEGIELRNQLTKMADDESYNTRTTYSTLDENGLTFVEKHMKYMSLYPNLNYWQYVSNLKLKTKIR